ncbi:hypothetical protein BD779DRAFT_1679985 [Infundibulicybe gibba]|nr:hypothetical protein BD779DRAFT_1679985 [Infundibulicybe gibba]
MPQLLPLSQDPSHGPIQTRARAMLPGGYRIVWLPAEIVLRIVQLGSQDPDCSLPSDRAILASHVCSRWRKLVVRCPSLWTDVCSRNIPSKKLSIAHAFTVLARSGQLPLDITIEVESGFLGGKWASVTSAVAGLIAPQSTGPPPSPIAGVYPPASDPHLAPLPPRLLPIAPRTPVVTDADCDAAPRALFSRLHQLRRLTLVHPDAYTVRALSHTPVMHPTPRPAHPMPLLSHLSLGCMDEQKFTSILDVLKERVTYDLIVPAVRRLEQVTVCFPRGRGQLDLAGSRVLLSRVADEVRREDMNYECQKDSRRSRTADI